MHNRFSSILWNTNWKLSRGLVRFDVLLQVFACAQKKVVHSITLHAQSDQR